MSHRLFIRSGATVAAASLAFLAGGPAFAAEPIAQASATALTLAVAGNGSGSGTFAATNDGTKETTSGTNTPALGSAAVGQSLINVGVATQDAVTQIAANGDGISDACSGVAGQGASVVSAGDGGSCLSGGANLDLSVGSVDLSGLSIGSGQIFGTLDDALAPATAALLPPLSGALNTALGGVLGGLGGAPLKLNLGAIEGHCHGTPSTATGNGTVAGLGLGINLPGLGQINIPLATGTAPNTHVFTNLSAITDALKTSLDNAVTGVVNDSSSPITAAVTALAPLVGGVDTLIDTLNANVLSALQSNLAPLQDNILDGIINKQSKPSANSIDITALDLQVLPAASAAVNASAISIEAGGAGCGPNSIYVKKTTPPTKKPNKPTAAEGTPTDVKSGLGSLESAPSALGLAGLAGLVLAGTGAGVAGFRRRINQL